MAEPAWVVGVHEIVSLLKGIVGPENTSADHDALAAYSRDYTEVHGAPPHVIVRPAATEEVQRIIQLAADRKIPLTPVAAASNVGGLAIPAGGGIQVDMRRMARVLEVHAQDLCMVIEPGVTWQDVKDHLDAHHPTLRFGYSLSPPDTSVLGNLLLDGLTNLSTRWGSQGQWLLGVEAVLPSGRIVRTGALARPGPPCTESPLPNLTGCFINWQGTTGIVTRAAVELQPQPAFQRRAFYLCHDIEGSLEFAIDLGRQDLCDDVAVLTWPVGRILFGELNGIHRHPEEPVTFVFIDHGSWDGELFRVKTKAIDRLSRKWRKRGCRMDPALDLQSLVGAVPEFRKFADWPMRLDFLLDHPGGGLTWVGTYGPTSRLAEGARRCHDLMLERGYPPLVVTRLMRGGHFSVLRSIAVFDHEDPASIKRVHALNESVADLCVDLGFFPYKAPRWVVDRYLHTLDPGFLDLLGSLKQALDPAGIMNPGRWTF